MNEKEYLILFTLFNHGELTANEVIDLVEADDKKKGRRRSDCKFYNHLNKPFAPLKRKGMIAEARKKTGPTNRTEKIWKITKKGEMYLLGIKKVA